jgi:hypothetical protein
MTLGKDWPLEEVQEALETYGFRVLGRERRKPDAAQKRKKRGRRQQAYAPDDILTETHYTIRRDLVCEACSQPFGYVFEVDQISRLHEAGRSTDGSLRRELGRQARRRQRCPHCRAAQKEPRRTLLRQDRQVVFQGCGVAGGGLLLTGALALIGGWLAGLFGFMAGLVIGLVGVGVLWSTVLPTIFARVPPI